MIILNILVFLFVLALMVFCHELGHFMAAKACGIYVDRFSLGMPPRVFGIRWGETDYCIGALPLGGYVKMAGQEDVPSGEEGQEHEFSHVPKERWFSSKPVWQRMIVILAGPAMNVVLAILLYGLVSYVGAEVSAAEHDNRVGYILENSVASVAPMYKMQGEDPSTARVTGEPDAIGWKTADRIVSINDAPVRNIRDVMFSAVLSNGNPLNTVIERLDAQGTPTRYLSPVLPKPLSETDPYPRVGASAFSTALVGDVQPGSPAESAGLKKDDVIVRVDGEIVDAPTFTMKVSKSAAGQRFTMDVKRGSEMVQLTVEPRRIGRITSLDTNPSLVTPIDKAAPTPEELKAPIEVLQVEVDFSKSTGVKAGDILVALNGEPANIGTLRSLQETNVGGTIKATFERPAILMGVAQKKETIEAELTVEAIGQVGVMFAEERIFYRLPLGESMKEAFHLCRQDLERTIMTLQSLFGGSVSTKELGGPILIYKMTTTAAQLGLATLLKMTAFISINLCIINLLPIPVADGGHMVFLTIEAIRRKPLDIRIMERIQQVGLVLLLFVFIYVTFNDIQRILFGFM